MPKDALGHGSNGRELSKLQTFMRMNPVQRAEYKRRVEVEGGEPKASNKEAKDELHSGTSKSAPAPVHGGAAGRIGDSHPETNAVMRAQAASSRPIGRHGYNPESVNAAIKGSRKPISAKEGSAIHRLLRGR